MRKRLSRKAMSLAEVVVAMAIILVVSASAASLVAYFTTAATRMTYRNEAVKLAENCLECFVYADSYAAFEEAVEGKLGVTFVDDEGVYTYATDDYTVRYTISYGPTSATMEIAAADAGGKEIWTAPPMRRTYR